MGRGLRDIYIYIYRGKKNISIKMRSKESDSGCLLDPSSNQILQTLSFYRGYRQEGFWI